MIECKISTINSTEILTVCPLAIFMAFIAARVVSQARPQQGWEGFYEISKVTREWVTNVLWNNG
jgi:hypothetical protein